MGREFDEEYYCVLEGLREVYGGADWIKCSRLARQEKSEVETVHRRYGIPNGVDGIDIRILARRKCRLAR